MIKQLLKYKTINKLAQIGISIFYLFNKYKQKQEKENIFCCYTSEQLYKLSKLIKEKYSDYYCIFTRYGLGDILYTASLIKEFKKRNNAKVVFFTEKKRLVKFLKAFESIDDVVYNKDLKFLQNNQVMQTTLKKGRLHKLFFPYRGEKKTYQFCDNYTNLFGLPLDTNRETPVISEENYQKARNEYNRLNLKPEKTVIIIPDAEMFDYRLLGDRLWEKVLKTLEEAGYTPVFNTKLKDFKKYKNTFIPIMDFLAFAKMAKYIVTTRSGINDVFGMMGLYNQTVIYPPNLEVIWADAVIFNELHRNHVKKYETELENIFNIHSLNATFKTDKIDEVIYNYNDDEITDNIIKRIGK